MALDVLGLENASGLEYERDQYRKMTGIIKERALKDAFTRIPHDPVRAAMEDLLAAEAEAAAKGLTAPHCVLSPESYADELAALATLDFWDRLKLRYIVYVPFEAVYYIEEKGLVQRRSDRLRIGGVKLFADGTFGARTAALREPYTDDPGNSGLLRHSDEELSQLVQVLDSKGLQVEMHAIGDAALKQAVDAISTVSGAKNPLRHTVIHASLAPKDLRTKMARHSIPAAVQPRFITSDSWARRRLGDARVNDLYPFKSMPRKGIAIIGGSDAPVETVDLMAGIYAATLHSDYAPEERLTLAESLSLYTTSAAVISKEESILESMEIGRPADFVLLGSAFDGAYLAKLEKVEVTATIEGGEVVHSH